MPGGAEPAPAPDPSAAGPVPDWPRLGSGGAALAQLEAALAGPVHAYLLVGTVAGDKVAVARTFAGELLVAAAQAAAGPAAAVPPEVAGRHRRRARQGTHPDVVVVKPEGRTLLAADATAIIAEAARRPLEGAGKAIICDRFHTAPPAVAASLLKTIEEPPTSVTVVLLADYVPAGHETVVSRCVTVRFPAPSPEEMLEWLVGAGLPPEPARLAARAVAVDPGCAGDLAASGDLAGRIEVWRSIPEQLDGTAAGAVAVVDRLRALIDEASEAVTGSPPARPDRSSRAVADPVGGAAGGGSDRSDRRRSDRQRRRARDAELRLGFALLAGRYGELLGSPEATEPVAGALALLRESAGALERNPDEKLLMLNLLLHLPGLADLQQA